MQDPDTLPPDRLLDLGGETVLVTGASGNIGGAIATRLAAAGARVILHCHRNRRFAEALAAKLDAAAVVQADLADAESVDAALSSHAPTMVVNNAAVQPVTALAAMTPSDWREVLTANLDSAFLVTRRAAETFGERGGAIVNIASIEGLDPAAGHAHYASSKAGLIMFTRAAALEYGPRGIRVNSVAMGWMWGPPVEGYIQGAAKQSGRTPEEVIAEITKDIPIGVIPDDSDCANAALFFASDLSAVVTGANLNCNGGEFMA